ARDRPKSTCRAPTSGANTRSRRDHLTKRLDRRAREEPRLRVGIVAAEALDRVLVVHVDDENASGRRLTIRPEGRPRDHDLIDEVLEVAEMRGPGLLAKGPRVRPVDALDEKQHEGEPSSGARDDEDAAEREKR